MLYASTPEDVTPTPLARVLHWLLPAHCLGCGEPDWRPRASLGLCPPCRSLLVRWPARTSCARCGRLIGAQELPPGYCCGRCRSAPPPFAALLSTWTYQPPLDAVLMGFKFRRLDYLGVQLGRALAEIHRREIGDVAAVVPVPLYWTRLLARGFDQAAILARSLAGELGLPYRRALRRRRPTLHQSRLAKDERRRNLETAFAVRDRAAWPGTRLLLVDDVTTTGATLRAAAGALSRAGAEVTALTVGRTPGPSEHVRLKAPMVEKGHTRCKKDTGSSRGGARGTSKDGWTGAGLV